jgi:hypothetical protein
MMTTLAPAATARSADSVRMISPSRKKRSPIFFGPKQARDAAARGDRGADGDVLAVAGAEDHALARVDVDRGDEDLIGELREVVQRQEALEVALEGVDREGAGEEVARIEEVPRARRAEERAHVEPGPLVTAPPRQPVRVEQHVEGDVLAVGRGDERARARADEHRRDDPDLFTSLEHTQMSQPTRGSPRAHEGNLETRHIGTFSIRPRWGNFVVGHWSVNSSTIRWTT